MKDEQVIIQDKDAGRILRKLRNEILRWTIEG